MSLRIGDKVIVDSKRMSGASRKAIILDFKWNLAQVQYSDGETEVDWVDCRYIKYESYL